MTAKTIPGFSTSLSDIMQADDKVIPLLVKDTQTLLSRLDTDGDWTTLLVQDTVGYEVVKALNFRGEIVVERGLSGTKPKKFPYGSCVVFSPSDELIQALACEADCCEEGNDTSYGTEAESVTKTPMPVLPTQLVGGVNAVLGEPDGFMYINGKKIPYYNE